MCSEVIWTDSFKRVHLSVEPQNSKYNLIIRPNTSLHCKIELAALHNKGLKLWTADDLPETWLFRLKILCRILLCLLLYLSIFMGLLRVDTLVFYQFHKKYILINMPKPLQYHPPYHMYYIDAYFTIIIDILAFIILVLCGCIRSKYPFIECNIF